MNLRGLIKYALWADTTQHGEFRALQRRLPPHSPKVVVDVGANDGFYGSNSFPFIARGWRAILIEPHPVVFAKLQKRFAHRPQVTCLNLACDQTAGAKPLYIGADGDEGTLATLCQDDHPHFRAARTAQSVSVPVETLSRVLEAQQMPHDFGVLSIDTEGMDCEVLLSLDLETWRPGVIITEDYEPKDARKFAYLESHGYQLQERISHNTLWSPASPRPALPPT